MTPIPARSRIRAGSRAGEGGVMAAAFGMRRAMRGLSEAAFRERFGTEEACREALLAMRWREGLTCPACGHRGFCALRTRKVFQCNRCKRQLSLTAGTVFQDSKLPLTAWFTAIYQLTQAKGGISVAPERDQQAPGEGDDRDPADPPALVAHARPEPAARRALGLVLDPQPGQLDHGVAQA